MFFESVVKNVRITFSHSLLETIFCLKFIDNAPLNLTQKLAKELCLSQFACPKKKLVTYTRVRKALLYHVLFSEPRFLHYVFVRIFYPKDHSKEVSNEIALEAVYRPMNGYFVDYASVILHHMYKIANLNRNPSLPYGNLLTWIFHSVQGATGP